MTRRCHVGVGWVCLPALILFLIQITTVGAATSYNILEPDSAAAPTPDYDVLPIMSGGAPGDSVGSVPGGDESGSVTRWVTEYEKTVRQEGLVRYEYFMDDGMNEAYTQCFGILFNHISFSRTNTRFEDVDYSIISNLVGRGDVGLLIATGAPLRWSSQFQVKKSKLFTIAMPLGFTVIHGLKSREAKSFVPYFGWGLGGIFGFERLSGDVTRYNDEFEWHDTCYRQAFEGHVLIGAQWKLRGVNRAVFELRWTQAGKGRLKRGHLSPQDLAQGWGGVFEEFQHPDFNFSGISADIGMRW